jgi:hypothetical protein
MDEIALWFSPNTRQLEQFLPRKMMGEQIPLDWREKEIINCRRKSRNKGQGWKFMSDMDFTGKFEPGNPNLHSADGEGAIRGATPQPLSRNIPPRMVMQWLTRVLERQITSPEHEPAGSEAQG